jgi:hypothetical protein
MIAGEILRNCGVFAWPQLLLSTLTVGIVGGYLVAIRRGEIPAGQSPWDRTLEPLAGIATTVGLLGSVAGFIVAFSGFGGESLNIERLTGGLSAAYWTTGVGIVTALFATVGAYALSVLNRTEA